MARIEDGIFTQAYTTEPGCTIDTTYKLWDATHALTASEASTMGKKLIKKDDETEYTMQETSSIATSALSAYQVISHPGKVGVGMRVYTNQVGSTSGVNVNFKLLDGDTVQLKVYAGTWLPICTVGCDKQGLTIFA